MESNQEEPPQINRRTFFKKAAKVAVGTAAVLAVAGEVKHEVVIAQTGEFETAGAIWHPIYERHDLHEQFLRPGNIPTDLDSLSLEEVPYSAPGTGYKFMTSTAFSMLTGISRGVDTTQNDRRTISTPTLEHLKKYGIEIAFGDISFMEDLTQWNYSANMAAITRVNIGAALLITSSSVESMGVAAKLLKIDRRSFLIKGGAVTMLTGLGIALPTYLREIFIKKAMNSIKDNSPEQRLWGRLCSINEVMMPEDIMGMFREMTQANKLLTIVENLQNNRKINKPKIGYNWHISHRGIEDWLRVNRSVLRACIMSYPDEILRQLIIFNGNDPRCLYAIRVVAVPSSLKQVTEDATGTTWSYDQTENSTSEIIEDFALKNLLKQRGLA